jgi:hypothetical protein
VKEIGSGWAGTLPVWGESTEAEQKLQIGKATWPDRAIFVPVSGDGAEGSAGSLLGEEGH